MRVSSLREVCGLLETAVSALESLSLGNGTSQQALWAKHLAEDLKTLDLLAQAETDGSEEVA